MWEVIHGQSRPVELTCFEEVIDALRMRCPTVRLRVHTSVARAIVPRQPGLDFDIHIALANRDELHLRAAGLKCRWVACGEPGVTEQFIDAVIGLIAGRNRIVLTVFLGRVIGCRLQQPTGRGWQTIARSDPRRPGLLWLCWSSIVMNSTAGRLTLSAKSKGRSPHSSQRSTSMS